jgi:hypothetical protein
MPATTSTVHLLRPAVAALVGCLLLALTACGGTEPPAMKVQPGTGAAATSPPRIYPPTSTPVALPFGDRSADERRMPGALGGGR